jgi:hypothetical protein
LSGEFELMLAQVFLEDVHFFCVLSGPHRTCSPPGAIKNKNPCVGQGAIDGIFLGRL